MLKVALTGSIAAGKSQAASYFRELGAPVFDADEAVHGLYAPGGAAVEPVSRLFPAALTPAGGIDRAILSRELAANPRKLAALEEIVHPLVWKMREDFLGRAARSGAPYVILDIPLLFETGGEGEVDEIIVVTAPAHIRRARALSRPGMTEDKLRLITARQTPEEEKRKCAGFVIDASGPLEKNRRQVERLHKALLELAARHPH